MCVCVCVHLPFLQNTRSGLFLVIKVINRSCLLQRRFMVITVVGVTRKE